MSFLTKRVEQIRDVTLEVFPTAIVINNSTIDNIILDTYNASQKHIQENNSIENDILIKLLNWVPVIAGVVDIASHQMARRSSIYDQLPRSDRITDLYKNIYGVIPDNDNLTLECISEMAIYYLSSEQIRKLP